MKDLVSRLQTGLRLSKRVFGAPLQIVAAAAANALDAFPYETVEGWFREAYAAVKAAAGAPVPDTEAVVVTFQGLVAAARRERHAAHAKVDVAGVADAVETVVGAAREVGKVAEEVAAAVTGVAEATKPKAPRRKKADG